MRRQLLLLSAAIALCSTAFASTGIFEVAAETMDNVIGYTTGQNAYDCSLFDTTCGLMDALIVQNSGQNIATVYPEATDVMNAKIDENSGMNVWEPIPETAITFGDRNHPTTVIVNDSANGSITMLPLDGSDAVMAAAGTVKISLKGNTQCDIDTVLSDDVLWSFNQEEIKISGDTVIYGALQLADSDTHLTINGNLYVFAEKNDYFMLNGGSVVVHGNVYLDGQRAYGLTLDGSLEATGNVYIYNHATGVQDNLIFNASLYCSSLLVCNNQPSVGVVHGVALNGGAYIVATDSIEFYGNAAKDGAGFAVGIVVNDGAVLQATNNITFINNTTAYPSAAAVLMYPNVVMGSGDSDNPAQVYFVGNYGQGSSNGVTCQAGFTFSDDCIVYSANNISDSGAGFYYNSSPLTTSGLSGAASATKSYTGPVPAFIATPTVLTGDKTGANVADIGSVAINGGTLTLSADAVVTGNLMVCGSTDHYLVLNGHTLTVQGDLILDGNNTNLGDVGHSVEIDGVISCDGHIVMQNHYNQTQDGMAISINIGSSVAATNSCSVVGNYQNLDVNGDNEGITVYHAGSIQCDSFNFVNNALQLNNNNAQASLLYCIGQISSTRTATFAGNRSGSIRNLYFTYDAGQDPVLIGSVGASNLNIVGNVSVCNQYEGATLNSTCVLVQGANLSVNVERTMNIIGNSASNDTDGTIGAVVISPDGADYYASLFAGQIEFLGNRATGTSGTGFTSYAVRIDDISGTSTANVNVSACCAIDVAGNTATTSAGYNSSDTMHGFCIAGSAVNSVCSMSTYNENSHINIVGNYAAQRGYALRTGNKALLQASAVGSQINICANTATPSGLGGFGVGFINSEFSLAASDTLLFLINYGTTMGLDLSGIILSGNCVDAYAADSGVTGLMYNGQPYNNAGPKLYTGVLPPLV